jgi:hypothetical protein
MITDEIYFTGYTFSRKHGYLNSELKMQNVELKNCRHSSDGRKRLKETGARPLFSASNQDL